MRLLLLRRHGIPLLPYFDWSIGSIAPFEIYVCEDFVSLAISLWNLEKPCEFAEMRDRPIRY